MINKFRDLLPFTDEVPAVTRREQKRRAKLIAAADPRTQAMLPLRRKHRHAGHQTTVRRLPGFAGIHACAH